MTTNNESKLILELAWAKVLLKSCLDVLETHNEPIVKRLRNDVSDFLKDDYNLLKNQRKINISEGNVKENDIFYKECCDKFIDYVKKSHNERVADTSKTIDHIADVSKKVSLTDKWKKGELESGIYYIKTKDGIENDGFDGKEFGFFSDMEIDQILGKVPSHEECKDLKLHDEKATIKLGEKIIENAKLKELLKRCRDFINYEVPDHCIDDVLIDKIDEALK